LSGALNPLCIQIAISNLKKEVEMKIKVVLLTLCLFVAMVTNALPEEDKIKIQFAWAFMNRFQPGSQQLGAPEGNVLQVGCIIKHSNFPIKEVTVKNLDSGVVLTAPPVNVGKIWSGLYELTPLPPFDPSKHMGVWEIRIIDEKGNEATFKTHKLDMKGEMPYLEGLKASGNPLAPTITWSAPNEKDIPQGARVRYQVRLLKDNNNQLYRSKGIFVTNFQIPEGVIKSEDLSKIYIRVQCQGWDKNDHEHSFPLELQSQTILPLKEILEKQ
jgi:hypothetical protein